MNIHIVMKQEFIDVSIESEVNIDALFFVTNESDLSDIVIDYAFINSNNSMRRARLSLHDFVFAHEHNASKHELLHVIDFEIIDQALRNMQHYTSTLDIKSNAIEHLTTQYNALRDSDLFEDMSENAIDARERVERALTCASNICDTMLSFNDVQYCEDTLNSKVISTMLSASKMLLDFVAQAYFDQKIDSRI